MSRKPTGKQEQPSGPPSRTSRQSRTAAARERAAAERARQRRRERGRRLALGVGGLTLSGAVTVGVLVGVNSGHKASPVRAHTDGVALAASQGTAQPPWPRPADTAQRAQGAGLLVASSEGSRVHFHVHLDILVNGTPTPVPADLGIGTTGLAELHTHDGTGVMHIESPQQTQWTLGQLFDEWNVRLSTTQIGGLAASPTSPLTAYVNGHAVPANPAAIRLRAHDEIALVYGKLASDQQVPKSFAFPAGE